MTFGRNEVVSTFGALVDINYEIGGKEFVIEGYRDAHPIIGDWSFMHYTGQPAVQRFSRNGTAQLSVPFQTTKGPYRIQNGTLHVQFEGKPPLELKIWREGNVLTTTDPNGKEIKFVRFEY